MEVVPIDYKTIVVITNVVVEDVFLVIKLLLIMKYIFLKNLILLDRFYILSSLMMVELNFNNLNIR